MGWGLDYVRDMAEKAWQAGGGAVEGLKRAAASTAEEFDQVVDWAERQMTPDIRAEGLGGHEIYNMFHGGPGTGSMDDAAQGWGGVAENHREAADAINSALARMRTSWQGEAATAAGAGTAPLSRASEHFAEQAGSLRAALQAQSEGFNNAKRHVVYVPPEPPTMSITAPINPFAPIDYAVEATRYFAAQEGNQRALQGYGRLTADLGARLPAFDRERVGDVRADFRDSGRVSTEDAEPGEPPARTQSAWRRANPPGTADDVTGGAGAAAGGAAAGAAFGAAAAGGRSVDRDTGRRGLFGGRFGGKGNGRGAGTGGLSGLRGLGGFRGGRGNPAGGAVVPRQPGAGTGRTGGTGANRSGATGSTRAGGAAASGTVPGRGRQEDDEKRRKRPDYLVETDPEAVFARDEKVAPPVFGDWKRKEGEPGGDED